jgi:hypothetical protein
VDTRQLALTMQSSEQAIKNQLLHDALHRGGYSTVCIVEAIWAAHLRHAIFEAESLLELRRRYSAGRLEEAAARAIFYGQGTARSVQRILRCGSDRLPINGECDIWGNPLTRLTPA